MELLIRYVHFLAILGLTASLAVQNAQLRPALTRHELRRLSMLDAVYGISALLVFGAGMLLWLGVGKPAEFYTGNPVFHIKLTLFLVIAAMSVFSTVFFLKHRGTADETVPVPGRVRTMKRLELALLMVMPLLGVFIARGVGTH